MTRKQVYAEMEEMFGLVPTFFKSIPDDSLEMEWHLMKQVQFDEGPVPNKYRELIGLGIAAVTRCRYCALFHTEVARLNGATDEEIADALRYAKSSAGWSAWLNGLQTDYDQFKREIQQIASYVRGLQQENGKMKKEMASA
jgi:AhpD family alkylhydroperoxidase